MHEKCITFDFLNQFSSLYLGNKFITVDLSHPCLDRRIHSIVLSLLSKTGTMPIEELIYNIITVQIYLLRELPT